MLWILLATMCLLAAGFAVLPFVRNLRRHMPAALGAAACVVGLSALIYAFNGRPDVPSGAGAPPDVAAMVESLARRLEAQPDDVNGWKMLGRSYMSLGRFDEAVTAYQRALDLEDRQNAQTLVDYGVALARAGGEDLSPQAIAVFENAVALAPADPEALFWGGIAAINKGDTATAADRWERLLATDPPPEVRSILTERIALWRGEAPAARGNDSESKPVVTVDVSVADAARAALPADAVVFVIARDPAQPSPPIAVARRRLAELPLRVPLGDRDAMIPGRLLSAYESFEVEARASSSGDPAASAGDWFGSVSVRPATATEAAVQIAEPVRR